MGTSKLSRIETATLEWRGDCPIAKSYGDIYFSPEDGMAESQWVFIQGNNLEQRWQSRPASFCIAELGFGSGLNFLLSCRRWLQLSQPEHCLHYLAVELQPFLPEDLHRAIGGFTPLSRELQALQAVYPPPVHGWHRLNLFDARVRLTLAYMDVHEWLGAAEFKADAWFLDGFAPASNAQMWQQDLWPMVAGHTAAGGTFATFTAAGAVRRGLVAAGFEVVKTPGFAGKREMLQGRLASKATRPVKPKQQPWFATPAVRYTEKTATVIGAGLAGVFTADSLLRRGWRVTVVDRLGAPAQATSGNAAAVIFNKFGAYDGLFERFYQQAYLYAVTHLPALIKTHKHYSACGMLQLAHSDREQQQQEELIAADLWPAEWLQSLGQVAATELAGLQLTRGGLFFPRSGWLDPRALCQTLLSAHAENRLCMNTEVVRIEYEPSSARWQVFAKQNELISQSSVLVLANALDATCFAETATLQLKAFRGQVTTLGATPQSAALNTVLCFGGYLTPAYQGQHYLGATFDADDYSLAPRNEDNERNLRTLAEVEPDVAAALQQSQTNNIRGAKAGLRCHSDDNLPLVGPVPDKNFYQSAYADLRKGRLNKDYPIAQVYPGLYINTGHGSKGVTGSPLAAEILAAYINAEPQPVPEKLRCALHPARFLIRNLKRKV